MQFDRAKLFSTSASTEKKLRACGVEFTVFVRRLPAVDVRKFHAEVQSEDIDVRARSGFEALHKSIRDAEGNAFATIEEYGRMDAEAIGALMTAFREVHAVRLDGDLGNA